MSNTCNGLKLELRPRASRYSPGSLPSFDAILSNISDSPVPFCAYLVTHRLLSTMKAGGWEIVPFRPTTREPIEAKDFLTLAPGQSSSFAIDLSKAAGEGYRIIWGGSQAPVMNEIQAAPGFPPGEFKFKVHLGDFVSFFTAAAGQSGPRERTHIVQEVPKSVPTPAGIWSGDLVAECSLTFA